MTVSTISFIGWAGFMVVVLCGLVVTARRSRGVQDETEDCASRALPEIGGIAEKRHTERFGRPATNAPGEGGVPRSWYPEAKKRVAKANVR